MKNFIMLFILLSISVFAEAKENFLGQKVTSSDTTSNPSKMKLRCLWSNPNEDGTFTPISMPTDTFEGSFSVNDQLNVNGVKCPWTITVDEENFEMRMSCEDYNGKWLSKSVPLFDNAFSLQYKPNSLQIIRIICDWTYTPSSVNQTERTNNSDKSTDPVEMKKTIEVRTP